MNQNLPGVQPGFRKARGTRDLIVNICWIIQKARKFQKNIYFCFMTLLKIFVWITTNCGTFLKRWKYQTTLAASWDIFKQVRKQQLESDMEQWIGSKSGKEYVKAVYCHPVYLTYILSTLCKMPAWMKHKLKSRLQGEIPITSGIIYIYIYKMQTLLKAIVGRMDWIVFPQKTWPGSNPGICKCNII